GPVPAFPGRGGYHHYLDFRAGIARGSFLTAGGGGWPRRTGGGGGHPPRAWPEPVPRAPPPPPPGTGPPRPRAPPHPPPPRPHPPAWAEAGGVGLPAMPAFYTRPRSLDDCINFVVGRVCDQLGVEHQLLRRWGTDPTPAEG